jgi:pimeloyl-ACP methyl ester carboxylesterase
MSAITIENDLVHYEVLGRGRPVILLHGWLGSWRYWIPAMQQLSMKYRTYALDLWGTAFGRSPSGWAWCASSGDDFIEKLGIGEVTAIRHLRGGRYRYAHETGPGGPLMAISAPVFERQGAPAR